MELTLSRNLFTDISTIGDLYWRGIWECFTLEDPVREGPKIPGNTAIPEGRYEVVIDWSDRFKRLMPHILNVPDFTGIRIHVLNTAEETEGCIGVGQRKIIDKILGSKRAFDKLFTKLEDVLKHEQVFITVCHKQESELMWP